MKTMTIMSTPAWLLCLLLMGMVVSTGAVASEMRARRGAEDTEVKAKAVREPPHLPYPNPANGQGQGRRQGQSEGRRAVPVPANQQQQQQQQQPPRPRHNQQPGNPPGQPQAQEQQKAQAFPRDHQPSLQRDGHSGVSVAPRSRDELPQPQGQAQEAGRGRLPNSTSRTGILKTYEERNVKEKAYKDQVERHRLRHELIRKQQESIRKQLELQKQRQLEDQQRQQQQVQFHPQQQQQQQRLRQTQYQNANNVNNNINNNNNVDRDFNPRQQNVPAEAFPKQDLPAPIRSPKPRFQSSDAGGAGVVVAPNDNNKDDDVLRRSQGRRNTEDNDNDVPDAPHGLANNGNNNNNNLNGLSDEFRRGLIKKVRGDEQSNLNNLPMERNAFPPEQPVRDIGGMNINWDWDDFSLTFQNYGAAEMKVRRAPHATTGEPWPLPQYYTKKDKNILVVDPKFEFVVSSNISCDVVDQAMERYRSRIMKHAMEDMYDNLQNAEGTRMDSPEKKYRSALYLKAPVISKFSLKIRKACSMFPSMDSDESYDLVIKKTSAYLWANEVWGLLRGLETLSQLIWRGPDDRLYVKETVISDYPRFPHRGILIDSSRHFIFKEVIFEMMDAMEMNKMNVMHWHIVDDQSFPYESQVFPELSAKGAYHPTFVYSLDDIADIIDYGRMRGIRVLPEFDSPGHTYSWGLSRPELLTQCYSGSSSVRGYLGPIDPVRNTTYRFLRTLFGEILNVFKDEFMHLGGDEVPLGCWQSNPDVIKFGEKLSRSAENPISDQQVYFGSPSPSIRLVYEYYVNRLMKDIKDLGRKRNGIKFIMWQEVMNNDLKLPNDTLIQVWMGDMADVSRAISLGYNVLYSSCWYLDHVEYGVKWPKYYQCDPADTSYGYTIDEKKVKGGEACLWSEYIDNENLIQTTWPRASAVAERLWSSKDTRNLDAAGERLSEHRCRMLRRGLSVGQVSGPDYCLKRGPSRGHDRKDSGCQGNACKSAKAAPVETHSDIKFRVRTETAASADCTWLFQMGGNVTILLLVAVVAFILLVRMSRTSGKLYTLRTCRQRTILVVFLTVLFVYFMCYTTMWMNVFEFSGTFNKRRPAS